MSRRGSFIAEVFLLLFVVLLSGCQSSADSLNKADQINIMYSDSYGAAVFELMMLNGSLEEALPEDVTVNWVFLSGSPEIREALVTGRIDLAVTGEPAVISAIENDLPIVVLSNSIFQSLKVYSSREDINQLEDMAPTDKMAVVTRGSTFDLALMLLGKERFGDVNHFNGNLVAMQHPEMFASLVSSDELACAMVGFPQTAQADQLENVFEIKDMTPLILENGIGAPIVTRQDFFSANPGLIDTIYQVLKETVDFMNDKPAEAARLLAGYYEGIAAEDVEAQIKSAPPKLEISESAYDKIAALMYEVGMLSKPPKKLSELPNYGSIPKEP